MNKDYLIDFNILDIPLYQPLQRMITYLQYGLLLLSFHISIGFDFEYITTPIGLLLIYVGLKMVRDANQYFRNAYIMVKVLLIIQIIQYASLCVPNFTLGLFNYIPVVLIYIMIFMIYLAMKNIIYDNQYNKKFVICYTLILACCLLGEFVMIEMKGIVVVVFLVLFIIMWKYLNLLKQELLQYTYCLQLSPMHISKKWIFLGYMTILIASIVVTFSVSILNQYKIRYIDRSDYDRNMTLVNEMKKTETVDQITIKYHYQIYEKDNKLHHLLEYELLDIPKHTYMVKTRFSYLYSNKLVKPATYHEQWIGRNLNEQYQESVQNIYETGWFEGRNWIERKAYINPCDSSVQGSVYFEGEKDKLDIFDFKIGLKSSFQFPYDEKVDHGIHLSFSQPTIDGGIQVYDSSVFEE